MLVVSRLYLYLVGMTDEPAEIKPRINPERQRAISSLGGKAAHAKGTAHEYTSAEAVEAGRKGGRAAWALQRAYKFTSETASAAGRKGAAARQAARLAARQAASAPQARVSTRVPVADLLDRSNAELATVLGVSRQWISTARKTGVSPKTRERWAQLLASPAEPAEPVEPAAPVAPAVLAPEPLAEDV